MNNKSADLTQGPLLKQIVLYTIPIILTGILQLLFNAADLVVVGQYCGSVSVGAVGATGPVINLITNLFIGFSVGSGVSVAHAIGAGKEDEIHRVIHTSIPLALICGLILTVVGIAGAEYILELMETPEEAIRLSALYMKIYFGGIISSMIYNFGAAILRAAGDTRSPLVHLTIAGVLNVILNLIFVIAFNMDVAGVALATIISQTLSAALILRTLMKRTDACKLVLKNMKIYMRPLFKILRIGFPAGIQGSLFSISNVIIQSSVNSFGAVAVAGNAAAQNIEGFVYTAMNSITQSALNFTGQNHGAKKFDRVKKTAFISLGFVMFVGLSLGISAYIFSRPLLSIYISDSEEAVKYGIVRLLYICVPYCLCGVMDVSTGLLRGLGSSILPMIITVAGVCGFRIVWIYSIFSIPQYHTLETLYISYIISWTMTFAVQIALYTVMFCLKKKKALSVGVL
ncbi:MAG: MATE family efflux transporter [Ruminococcus sp.]|nr:MATE family efflux transporter [Ruminococcus sp.]